MAASTTLNTILRGSQELAPQDDGSLRLEVFREVLGKFTAHLRLLATGCARVLQIHFAPKKRGRREDRVRAAPAVSRARVDQKTHTSIQVQRKQSGLPCAMVLQLISCSPRRDLACLSPSPPRSASSFKNLTPAIGASGPHDFAVRISAVRRAAPSRPSHPTPRFVTCATPLSSGEMAIEVKLICLRDQP
jgi:hypothetical protein